jgi:hypothetical protein
MLQEGLLHLVLRKSDADTGSDTRQQRSRPSAPGNALAKPTTNVSEIGRPYHRELHILSTPPKVLTADTARGQAPILWEVLRISGLRKWTAVDFSQTLGDGTQVPLLTCRNTPPIVKEKRRTTRDVTRKRGESEGTGRAGHRKDRMTQKISRWQSSLQPSPDITFPSSHVSPQRLSTRPSPHRGTFLHPGPQPDFG